MTTQRTMTIHFNDGANLSFEFPKQADRMAVTAKAEKLLSAPNLTVEADGTVILIPLTSVKYVQVFPAPEVLPGGVIKGATLIS